MKNIPYRDKKGPEITNSSFDVKEEKEWSLTPKQSIDYMDGSKKPINVKETMLENIRKHSEPIGVNEVVVSVDPEIKIDVPEQQDEKVENEPVVVNEPVSDVKEEIGDIRQQFLMKREAFVQEQVEADESDKKVQDLGVQYTEVQKQIEESTQRREEALRRKTALEKSQSETMRNELKKYDSLFQEVRDRKEKNKLLIQELETKINNGMEEIRIINEDIARIEEETNALSFDGMVVPTAVEEEQFVKRIA